MSVLLVEETKIPCENHRSVATVWKTLSYNVLSSGPSPWSWFELTTFKWLIIKGVTRSRNSKKDMQYNGNTKKDKRANSDLQNTAPKSKHWAARTSKTTVVNSCVLEG